MAFEYKPPLWFLPTVLYKAFHLLQKFMIFDTKKSSILHMEQQNTGLVYQFISTLVSAKYIFK